MDGLLNNEGETKREEKRKDKRKTSLFRYSLKWVKENPLG